MNLRKIDTSKEYNELYNRWRMYEILSTVFSMMGLIASIIAYELDIQKFNHVHFAGVGKFGSEEDVYSFDFTELAHESLRNHTWYCQPIKWFCFVTTIISIILLVLKRIDEVKWINMYLANFLNQPHGSLFFYYHNAINSDVKITIDDPYFKERSRVFH